MSRRSLIGRDQSVSAFSAILFRFCDATGVLAAALTDGEGETVDYAGALDPFDIKIAAAESAVLLHAVREAGALDWDVSREIIIRGAVRSLALYTLSDGYALMALLPRGAFGVSGRALQEVLRDLGEEAGLSSEHPVLRASERWIHVDVSTALGDCRRPESVWLQGGWCPLDILGRYIAGPHSRDLGYRVRLTNGAELTLVRERLGVWFADELPLGA
ncbi:MAG: hypothetical protein KC766_37150 [Myxococcales bacterium]|nr:hypothetical protein [Myxococcales bacterium]